MNLAESDPTTSKAPDHTRRNRALGIGLALVVGSSAIGWLAGRQIRSPAEIAARTAPPKASLITVPVEKRTLTSDVVVRGTVRYGSPRNVSLPKSALKLGTSIVTSAPAKGAALDEGNVAMTMSGRPVLILKGVIPAYRDLGPGAQGTDVQQLEDALARLGFDPGPRDGRYDGRTGSAVSAWYRSAGWTGFGPTEEQRLALRAVEADLFSVQSDGLNAEDTLIAARGTQTTAVADIANKRAALNAAIDAEKVAQLELDEGRAADPPLSNSQIRSLEAAVRHATGGISTARAELDAANAAASMAADSIRIGQRRITLLSKRDKAIGGIVGEMAGKLGTQVPADEVLFFPGFPVRVDDVTVKTGEEPTGPVMTVSTSGLSIDAALSLNDAKLVHGGAEVTIEAPELGVRASGIVTTIADTPGTQGVDPQRFFMQVTPTDAPASLVGASVVLTIKVSSTEGEVLAVPVSALSVAADGTSRVQVREPNGTTRYVTVTPGLAAKGLVAVTPIKGHLAAGDLVILGRGTGGISSVPAPTVPTPTLSPALTPTGSPGGSPLAPTLSPAGSPLGGTSGR